MFFTKFQHRHLGFWTTGRITAILSCAIILFATSGCGDKGDSTKKKTTAKTTKKPADKNNASTTKKAPADKSKTPAIKPKKTASKPKKEANQGATGTLAGTITFEGTVPVFAPLVKKGDQTVKDFKVCTEHEVPNESLLVDKSNNGLGNVFVYLRKAPKGMDIPAAGKPVVLDQKNCHFVPHACVVRTGQSLLVKSDDDATHNIHTFPFRNTSFNQSMSGRNREGLGVSFESSEVVPMTIKCDVHTWMSAYILPLDHPFGTVTDSKGSFEIKGLPVGKHKIRIWHERSGYLSDKGGSEIEIKANETTKMTLKFPSDKFEN